VSVEINNETSYDVDHERVLRLAEHALDKLRIHPEAELAIQFVDEEPMTELNVQWMDEQGPTDVLSFPMDELRPSEHPKPGMLGDIVTIVKVRGRDVAYLWGINNISVGIQYLGAWLAGNGCVPVFNLMEDAATAEISRSQIWQWIRSPKGKLDDGRKVTADLVKALVAEELPKVKTYLGDEAYAAGKYPEAAVMFEKMCTGDYNEFLTLPAYELID
jgi:hypothetical protein